MRLAFRLAFVAATFALATSGARAQGTDAQRDACTPDALRLCQATIPNVARTTACLVAHKAQLGPSCRGVFAFAEPVADRMTPAEADHVRPHSRPRLAYRARPHHRIHDARRVVPYHIPRFSQAQAEAEVHQEYGYRTPYLPYWVFPQAIRAAGRRRPGTSRR